MYCIFSFRHLFVTLICGLFFCVCFCHVCFCMGFLLLLFYSLSLFIFCFYYRFPVSFWGWCRLVGRSFGWKWGKAYVIFWLYSFWLYENQLLHTIYIHMHIERETTKNCVVAPVFICIVCYIFFVFLLFIEGFLYHHKMHYFWCSSIASVSVHFATLLLPNTVCWSLQLSSLHCPLL